MCRRAVAGMLLACTMLLADVISPVKVQAASTMDGATSHSLLASQLVDKSVDGSPAVVFVESSETVAETVRLSMTMAHAVSTAGGLGPTTHFSADMPVQSAPTDMAPIIFEKTAEYPIQSEPIEMAQNASDTFSPLTDEEIRQQLLIDPTAGIDFDAPRAVPSSTFLTPSAYGADWGDAFVGLAGVTAGNVRNRLDGSASLGLGFGDAVDNIGVEVSVGILSLEGFAEDGVAGFKLHKVFPNANNFAVALGWADPIKWGDASGAENTFYGVATHQFALRPSRSNSMPLSVSMGVGTGTFRSTGAIAADDNAPNVFGSVGWRVVPEVSLITSWTGSGLGFATSAAPFDSPLIFTAGVSDLTDNTPDGTRFNGSMGYSFSF